MNRQLQKALILFVLLNPHWVEAKTVYTFCEDPWPPFTIGYKGMAPTGGISVKILEEIFAQMEGVEIKMILLPWKRCLHDVESGNIDGLMMALKSKQRPYLIYPEPVLNYNVRLFYLKNKFPEGFQWNGVEDLSQYWIGLLAGSTMGEQFDTAMEKGILKVEQSRDFELNFRKLMIQRVDLVVSNEIVGDYWAHQNGVSHLIEKHPKSVLESPYYIPISKKSSLVQHLPTLNRVILQLKESKAIQRIVEKQLASSTIAPSPQCAEC